MKFFVYTLMGGRASRVADPLKVNALPAREALQSMYLIGSRLLLKLPATPDEPFEVHTYTIADSLADARRLCQLDVQEFQKAAFIPKARRT